jgi:hypothetical protein
MHIADLFLDTSAEPGQLKCLALRKEEEAMSEVILMIHPALGVLAILATVWALVEALNAAPVRHWRLRAATLSGAVLIWLTYVVGGYWYLVFYAADKALIKKGPWPFAHNLVMESKEHVFLLLLLLATYLPVVAWRNLEQRPGARTLVIAIAALVVLTGLGMEGAGAVISMGVKTALLSKPV